MKTYKEFLNENTEVITEATKKDILAFMTQAQWTKHDAYLFGIFAKSKGLFKSDNAGAAAFGKYYEEYSKMESGNGPRPIFKGGDIVMSKGGAPAKPAAKAEPSAFDKKLKGLGVAAGMDKHNFYD